MLPPPHTRRDLDIFPSGTISENFSITDKETFTINNLSVQKLYNEEGNYSFSVISDNKTLLKKLLEVWSNYTKTIFEDDKSQEEIDKCYKKCIESVFKDSDIFSYGIDLVQSTEVRPESENLQAKTASPFREAVLDALNLEEKKIKHALGRFSISNNVAIFRYVYMARYWIKIYALPREVPYQCYKEFTTSYHLAYDGVELIGYSENFKDFDKSYNFYNRTILKLSHLP